MTSINGFTPTYENNGNVPNDNSHTYSWDSEGRPAPINSVNLTYDALGRLVEQNRNAVYTQFVYAPTGQKIQIMNGQATTTGRPPGGGLAVYASTGQYYYQFFAKAISVGETATAKTVSKAFAVFSAAKLVYDVSAYGYAYARCGGN